MSHETIVCNDVQYLNTAFELKSVEIKDCHSNGLSKQTLGKALGETAVSPENWSIVHRLFSFDEQCFLHGSSFRKVLFAV